MEKAQSLKVVISHLHNKKVKNQFLHRIKELGHRANCCLLNWRDMQGNTKTPRYWEQKTVLLGTLSWFLCCYKTVPDIV
jgi:hypothetical protein